MAIEAGEIDELSASYQSEDIKQNGNFENKNYDIKQTNMILNHLALTEVGRAGENVKILISKQNSKGEEDNMKTNEKGEPVEDKKPDEKKKENELSLESLDEKINALTEIVQELVDKKPDKANAEADEPKEPKEPEPKDEKKENSLSMADVESMMVERDEILQSAKNVLGEKDAHLIAAKYNSMDELMRHVLVKAGEFSTENVKKLNSLQLRAEYRAAAKYAAKLNSQPEPQENHFEQSSNSIFDDAKNFQLN